MTETVLPSIDGGAGPAGLALADLRAAYASGRVTPSALVGEVLARIAARADNAWITVRSEAELLAVARRLERAAADRGIDDLPLYGVPVGVKDSIDVVGLPTTNACPDYAYLPVTSATAVRRLEAAGAFVVGKTNLDQFATGLNGTRSPYGVCESVYGGGLISGGSSSGSAVAVAAGVVPVALATDTAGSGRVPAAMNGIVGLKPTTGMISTAGLVPACRSADCITVMATRVDDAMTVYGVAAAPDPGSPWSRPEPRGLAHPPPGRPPRLGLPAPVALEFFGDDVMRAAHLTARAHAAADLGADTVDVDLAPFLEAGDLLYGGPWVAERDADLGDFIRANPGAVLPVIRDIIVGGPAYTAVDTFRAQHRLMRLRHQVRGVWDHVDALLLPTVGTTFTIDEMRADPVDRNTMLGHYTRFGNLLDLAALAFPAGSAPDGRPLSLMLVGPARSDRVLAALAAQLLGEPAMSSR